MMKPQTRSAIVTFAALALAVGTAQSATIYAHSFGGDGADPLDGVTPDTTTAGATWAASSDINADGTIAGRSSNGSDSAWLPFTPASGFVYTLTAVMGQETINDGASANGSWMALGFSADNATGSFFGAPNNTSPWVLHRAPGADGANENRVVSFTGPGVSGLNQTHDPFVGTITLSIVLDTTDTQWTATWFEGSNELRSYTYDVDENPDISYVGFGRSNRSVGPVESFSFTAIPEPSAALLGGLGILCLLRRRG